MQWSQLKKFVEDLGLPDHAEVLIETDDGGTFGIGFIDENDGRVQISVGDEVIED